MKKFLIPIIVSIGLAGCFNPLDLNPTQQANLQLWIQAGKTVVQATANLYCEFEPSTSKIIQVFDTSNNTVTTLAKLDQATTVACNLALSQGLIVK